MSNKLTTYSIKNSKGMEVVATDFGATIVSIFVKDKTGDTKDIVLGYDTEEEYKRMDCYFGATVGRYANRISDAKIVIDGVEYQLEANDNENSLHSGSKGMAGKKWDVKEVCENKITFVVKSADLEEGFPGHAVMEVTYEVTEENELVIDYRATADKKTTFNLTNHSYFNLNGHASNEVYTHMLQINASGYTPVKNEKAIPTGEIAPVEGTPFDFRKAKPIGQDIKADFDQIKYGNGFDHNFAIDKKTDGVEQIASVYAPESKIMMDVFTDLPGVQLYTANFVGGQVGKGGVKYVNNGAFCLETQYFPNAINEPNFKRPITDVGETYQTKTIYRFSVK